MYTMFAKALSGYTAEACVVTLWCTRFIISVIFHYKVYFKGDPYAHKISKQENEIIIHLFHFKTHMMIHCRRQLKQLTQYFSQDYSSTRHSSPGPHFLDLLLDYLISLEAFHFMFVVLWKPALSSNLGGQLFIKCEIRYSVNEALSLNLMTDSKSGMFSAWIP